jgi:DNA mismatch endonuclease (patch repair protein)
MLVPADSWASSPAVRKVMRANRGRDTRPEIALRKALFAAGMRYRVNFRPIPKSRMTCDIAFPRNRIAVELRGCFWHGCPQHHRPAVRNGEFWSAKIAGNVQRDARKEQAMREVGWELVVVWEHDDVATSVKRVRSALDQRRVAE